MRLLASLTTRDNVLPMNDGRYITTGDIARYARLPLHRVTYAIQRLRLVEDARAGTYRLFRVDRIESIVEAINRMDSERTALARGSHVSIRDMRASQLHHDD